MGQDRGARRELVEDDLLDVDPGPLDARPQVLDERRCARDDVDVDFELDAVHPERVPDPVLVVDDELLGDDVDDLPVGRDRDGLGLFDDAFDVFPGNLPIFPGDRDHAPAVEALDVRARYPDERGVHGDAGHEFRLFLGFLDGGRGDVEVDDDALPQALGIGRADPDDLDLALLGDLADDGGHLPRPDVDPDDVPVLGH